MAIALDTAGGTYARTASQTVSNFTFDNVAGDFLVCMFATNKNTDDVTSVTYNGVAMSLAKKQLGNGEYGYGYYLANPATGSNTLAITTGIATVKDCGIASYTGVDTSSPIDGTFSTTIGSGASATITSTIVTATDNCWMVSFSGLQRESTASTNSTYRSGVSIGGKLYDSNGAITPAGSFSMVQSIAASGPATAVAFTFKPASAGATFTPRVSFFM